jgi:murein DD-endopeptidase MepM/ murein hydrolase activator NlpD
MTRCLYKLCLLFVFSGLVACQKIPNNDINHDYPISNYPMQAITGEYPKPSIEPLLNTPVLATADLIITITPTSGHALVHTPTATEIPFNVCSPLAGETISSLFEIITNPFGNPPVGREDLHHGVDFAYYRRGDRLSIEGELIQSILPGFVSASIIDRLPYGNVVIIETPKIMLSKYIIDKFGIMEGESLYSLYAHMGQPPQVELGDFVICGQELGTVGKSGYDIVNPHLHLETRIGPSDEIFTGMAFYDTSAVKEEMENYKRWRTDGDFRNIDPMVVFQEVLINVDPVNYTPTP